MAYFNYKKRAAIKDKMAHLKFTSPDLVNPLYKPKTLGELKAEMTHTGINPAPIGLRSPLPELDGFDNIDAPPVIVGGDTFENIRRSRMIGNKLDDSLRDAKAHKERMKQNDGDQSKDKSPE